jgi:hypothetical protein
MSHDLANLGELENKRDKKSQKENQLKTVTEVQMERKGYGMGSKEGQIAYLELFDRHLIVVLDQDEQLIDFGDILQKLDKRGNLKW